MHSARFRTGNPRFEFVVVFQGERGGGGGVGAGGIRPTHKSFYWCSVFFI